MQAWKDLAQPPGPCEQLFTQLLRGTVERNEQKGFSSYKRRYWKHFGLCAQVKGDNMMVVKRGEQGKRCPNYICTERQLVGV